VWLRGTTPEGDELELEIAVQRLSAPGKTIHQLAARKILQELKDGTSYVHSAIDKERQPALLTEWVKKEGVRVGLKYGIAGHWTSFVAVERREEERETESRDQGFVDVPPPSGLDDNEEWDTVDTELGDGNETPGGSRGGPSAGMCSSLIRQKKWRSKISMIQLLLDGESGEVQDFQSQS
jgi:hypothetical protein